MKVTLLSLLILFSSVNLFAQRQMENLNHGLTAIKTSHGVFVSWRIPANEYDHVSYNLYRDGAKVNDAPVFTKSNLLDNAGTEQSTYTLHTVINGVETATNDSASVWAQNYLDIPVRPIDGGFSTYELNDASVGDLDGDGEYEIVVKRLAKIHHPDSSYYHYLEAYELDGTFMWAVNMGPNIYNRVEFNFLVWDLDQDGKAEVTLRTSEGFVDALGNKIGDVNGDNITNYRYSISWVNYRTQGPDFLSVIDGETGKEITRTGYIPRGSANDWGKTNDGGHRSTKCMYTVAYLDGKTPSIVTSRGIYERTAMAAYNFDGTSLTKLWHFDSDTPGNSAYAGQGYHNLTQGDVDNDGKDEIMYGSMCMDDDGTGLYSTGYGHGDALHLSDINPDWKGLEFFGCLEERGGGGNYRNAGTGEVYFHQTIGRDMGRGGCSDITASYPGMEMWGASGFPFVSANGEVITNLTPPGSMNFFIWWDGDPLREMLDHKWLTSYGIGTITKYNNGANTRLLDATGTLSNNWTKGTPCVSADILGDWREEVVWRTSNNDALRLYTTTYPSEYKLYTLMHDPQYRAAIGWQPNSYNQPPHPSFFIGHDMDSIPPSPQMLPGQKTWKQGAWDKAQNAAWEYEGATSTFEDGDLVLFDISGNHSSDIVINGDVAPADIRVISPIDYVFSGSGTISGKADLTKAGKGSLTINNDASFSGITRVWDGQLNINGHLSQSQVLAKRFTTIAGSGHLGNGLSLEKLSILIVSKQKELAGTLTVDNTLQLADETVLHFDLSDDPEGTSKANDQIILNGDLSWGKTTFDCHRLDGQLGIGDYVLCTVSGDVSGDLEDITILGAEGELIAMVYEDHRLILRTSAKRAATSIEWHGSESNVWDLVSTLNWLNAGTPDYFRENDEIVFNNNAQQLEVEVVGDLPTKSLIYQGNKDFNIVGNGSISTGASLIIDGSGVFKVKTQNSYTGTTTINSGVLQIEELKNGEQASNLGQAGSDPSRLVFNGGLLQIEGASSSTNKGFTLQSNGGSILVSDPNNVQAFNGTIIGNGTLTKKGAGTLSLASSNTFSGGSIIEDGSIILTSDEANEAGLGTGTISIINGTIIQNDNQNSSNVTAYHIDIPQSGVANYHIDSRCFNRDSITGQGELNLTIPYFRADFEGNWSGFEGKINILTDHDGGEFRIDNKYGYPNAAVHLNDKVKAYRLGNDTARIGQLTGTSASSLSNSVWIIGEKGTDGEYAGTILGGEVVKRGSGRLTLSNSANYYKNGTTVEQGSLWLTNTSGNATGEGDVLVKSNAVIGGNGFVNSNISLEAGAYLVPGDALGKFTTKKSIRFGKGSIASFDLDVANSKNDNITADSIVFDQSIIFLVNTSTDNYGVGEQFKLFTASKIVGKVANVYPKNPAAGLFWDTRELYTKGIIKVSDQETTGLMSAQHHQLKVYPTIVSDVLTVELPDVAIDNVQTKLYNQSGCLVKTSIGQNSKTLQIDLSSLPQGFYFLETNCNNTKYINRICKQ